MHGWCSRESVTVMFELNKWKERVIVSYRREIIKFFFFLKNLCWIYLFDTVYIYNQYICIYVRRHISTVDGLYLWDKDSILYQCLFTSIFYNCLSSYVWLFISTSNFGLYTIGWFSQFSFKECAIWSLIQTVWASFSLIW